MGRNIIYLIIGLIGSGVLAVLYNKYKSHIVMPPLKTFRKEYIDKVGERLKSFFGVEHKSFDLNVVETFDHTNVVGLQTIANRIKDHYKLTCNIVVHESPTTIPSDNGRGISAAWIEIPDKIPDPKSEAFKNFTFNVTVTTDTLKSSSLIVIVMYMAHELAHAMLHSHDHPDKASEIATDMLAILYGFDNGYFEINKIQLDSLDHIKFQAKQVLESEYAAQKDSESQYASRAEKLYAYFTLKPENVNKFIIAQVVDFLFDKLLAKLVGK